MRHVSTPLAQTSVWLRRQLRRFQSIIAPVLRAKKVSRSPEKAVPVTRLVAGSGELLVAFVSLGRSAHLASYSLRPVFGCGCTRTTTLFTGFGGQPRPSQGLKVARIPAKTAGMRSRNGGGAGPWGACPRGPGPCWGLPGVSRRRRKPEQRASSESPKAARQPGAAATQAVPGAPLARPEPSPEPEPAADSR